VEPEAKPIHIGPELNMGARGACARGAGLLVARVQSAAAPLMNLRPCLSGRHEGQTVPTQPRSTRRW
jgi:hypothetical protein